MYFRRVASTSGLAVAILLAVGRVAYGQSNNIVASVTITAPIVTGSGVRPLAFGTIPVNTTTSVAPGPTTSSGQFTINGLRSQNRIDVTFGLPAELRNVNEPTFTVPISFAGPTAMGCLEYNPPQTDCSSWDPTLNGGTHRVKGPFWVGGRTGTVHIYIGGSVTPPSDAAAGLYTGTITLTYAAL